MQSRAERTVAWIENYCIVPFGPGKGKPVRLSPDERALVRAIYADDGSNPQPVSGRLAAFLILVHLCGKEALVAPPPPEYVADTFTLWNAAGPLLRHYLRRDGEAIICPELQRSWRAA